ncbi:hypothetical protein AAHA92_17451 [Salvia divinorum]|uniref:Uncharacterized protein n=1 Tax=Salvia divinorum TaxID=28513 RepID=A0ABD1GYT2_SALDI
MDMLNKQLSQIATSLNEMRGNEGRIPATVKIPEKENVIMITLRSSGSKETDKLTKETGQKGNVFGLQREDLRAPLPKSTDPFFLELERATEEKERERKKEVLLLERTSEKIKVDKKVFAVIQEFPSKHADPGMFTLPITMGGERIDHAICDLGASINILPLLVYQKMKGTKIVHTEREIQLADGSCIRPEGILENAIVQVHNFFYPADFHVIKMTDAESAGSSRVLLGRPFLKTAKALIDVFVGTICLNYHGKKYTFGVDKITLSLSMEDLNAVSIAKPLVQESSEEEKLKENFEAGGVEELEKEAVGWLKNVKTQGLSDQELDEAMVSFCQVPKAAEPKGRCQEEGIARMPKLKEQNLLMIEKGVSTKEVHEKAVCNAVPEGRVKTKKLSSVCEDEYGGNCSKEAVEIKKKKAIEQESKIDSEKGEVKEADGEMGNKMTPEGEGDEDSIPLAERSRGERNNGGKSILPITNTTTPRPETGERQGKLQLQRSEELRLDAHGSARQCKEKTNSCRTEKMEAKRLKIGQKMPFFQSRLTMMPRKWKPEWTKPFNIGALRADQAVGPRGSPFYSKFLIVYCLRERVRKDRSGLCVVRGVSLRMTTLSSI